MYKLYISRSVSRNLLQPRLKLRYLNQFRRNHVSSLPAKSPQQSPVYGLIWAAFGAVVTYTAISLSQSRNNFSKEERQKTPSKYADKAAMFLVFYPNCFVKRLLLIIPVFLLFLKGSPKDTANNWRRQCKFRPRRY